MDQAEENFYRVTCIYSRSLKSMFESVGKITLDRMVFYMLFKAGEIRLILRDSSGLSNSITIKETLFEEVEISRPGSEEAQFLVKMDLKDFNCIQKFLVPESFLTIRYNEEKGKVTFICQEENDKCKEVRKLKIRELKTQTQIDLSASFPEAEDCIGEIKFNGSGAAAFKACIEKTFSSKHKYLLFHFNTEKSHLMITNEEIKEGEIEQYDFVCHIFPNDAVKGNFRSSSDFKFYYSYKLLHYITGFMMKDISILMKVYSSGALSFSYTWNTNIEVSTTMPASNSEND